MFELSLNNIEQKLSKLTIEELLELEEKIMKIRKKSEDWKKDFLEYYPSPLLYESSSKIFMDVLIKMHSIKIQ
jgi:hypothetical protein